MPDETQLGIYDYFRYCAQILGVEVVETVDAFGRRCVAVEPGGLHRMRDVARSRGHLEVAQQIEQMIAEAEPIDGRPPG